MPTPRLDEKVLQLSVDAFALHGEKEAAATSLGIAGTTLHHRLREAALRGILPTNERPQPKPNGYLPTGERLPPKQIPTADIIAHRKRQFEQRRAYHAAKRWRRFTVPTRGPYALMFFGDPHLDDDGCNITLFEQHAELAAETEHLYAINIGDTTNNWAGRLAKLWANQDASADKLNAVTCFLDPFEGAEFLQWKRRKVAA